MTEFQPVYTVGHSNHPLVDFVALLRGHDVAAVADVRSNPFSRHVPQYNKASLRTALRACGIQYVFLGRELGARSKDPGCYIDGRVQYDRLAATEPFQEGVRRILNGAQTQRISLMCAEKDPLDCHRTLLVAQRLVDEGSDIHHILADGAAESHQETLLRLLDKLSIQHPSMLHSTDELIADALAKQEERIAYVDVGLASLSDQSA